MNNYEKLEVVGRGAHGTVYLCRRLNDDFGHRVIVKEIPVDGMSLQERQNALGEVKTLQMLSHPNIIGYYENFLEDNVLCIVMQYAEGGTLGEMLQRRKGLVMEEEQILYYFCQLLLSLNYIHSKQILHRDLKPQNILLNRSKKICKLSDFGISKHLLSKSQVSTFIGTPSYLSPEICEGRAYNHKSDIWSLGCVLYEMITLKRAFEAETLPALAIKITKGKYPPIGDHVSSSLCSLVDSMLDLNESRRPTTGEILQSTLVLCHAMRLMADLGLLKGPSASPLTRNAQKSPRTPTGSHKLKTRSDSKLSGQMSPQWSTPAKYRIYHWTEGAAPTSLSIPSSHSHINQVACGGTQKYAIGARGRLLFWEEADGSMESPSCSSSNVPVLRLKPRQLKMNSPLTISKVACGEMFTVFVTDQGVLMSSGSGANGCLGHGDCIDRVNPKIVESLMSTSVTQEEAYIQVACGRAHVIALTSDGDLYAWGKRDNGRLGLPTGGSSERSVCTPTRVDDVTSASNAELRRVFCSMDASAVLDSQGRLYATGNNCSNKLGVWVDESHKSARERRNEKAKSAPNFGTKTTVTTGNSSNWVVDRFTLARALPTIDLMQPQPYSLATNHAAFVSVGRLYTIGSPFGLGGSGESLTPRLVPLPGDSAPRRVVCAETLTVVAASDQTVYSFGRRPLSVVQQQYVGRSRHQLPTNEQKPTMVDLDAIANANSDGANSSFIHDSVDSSRHVTSPPRRELVWLDADDSSVMIAVKEMRRVS